MSAPKTAVTCQNMPINKISSIEHLKPCNSKTKQKPHTSLREIVTTNTFLEEPTHKIQHHIQCIVIGNLSH